MNYKSTLKHIVLSIANKSKSYKEFYKTIISEYKISVSMIAELGYTYILEMKDGYYEGVILYNDVEECCNLLKRHYNAFLYGNDHTDAFISDDKCYATIDTKDDDWMFRAKIYTIGDEYD